MRLHFRSIHEALHQGFMVMDRIPSGYLMRRSITRNGKQAWQMAIVTIAGAR